MPADFGGGSSHSMGRRRRTGYEPPPLLCTQNLPASASRKGRQKYLPGTLESCCSCQAGRQWVSPGLAQGTAAFDAVGKGRGTICSTTQELLRTAVGL